MMQWMHAIRPFLALSPDRLMQAMLSSPLCIAPTAEAILASAQARGGHSAATSVRLFVLRRLADETGTSGTGDVAVGVTAGERTGMVWLTKVGSLAWYPSLDAVEAIHGHGGRSVVAFPVLVRGPFVDEHYPLHGGDVGNIGRGCHNAGLRLDLWRDGTLSLLCEGVEDGRPFVEISRRRPDGAVTDFHRHTERTIGDHQITYKTGPWQATEHGFWDIDRWLTGCALIAGELNGGMR